MSGLATRSHQIGYHELIEMGVWELNTKTAAEQLAWETGLEGIF